MYPRMLKIPAQTSVLLLGPRGTGKSFWVRHQYPDDLYIDLLNAETYNELTFRPGRLSERIPKNYRGTVIIDEIQKVPELLNEVHRLIELKGLTFILTGSSARSLRKKGVNLLAGRARTCSLFSLTSHELGKDFNLERALRWGTLPMAIQESEPQEFLESYVRTYLREEVLQEGLTRNLAAFGRFIEVASFSQASPLNISNVARECEVERKVVTSYFQILEDLLIATRIPVFTKRAQRRVVKRPKFFFFDVGVYRAIRPHGPLDRVEEIEGVALESFVFQELRALNSYLKTKYDISYWRTSHGAEVDFVLYGPKGFIAFEVKRSGRIRKEDLSGPLSFLKEYPTASVAVVYMGQEERNIKGIKILPIHSLLPQLPDILSRGSI